MTRNPSNIDWLEGWLEHVIDRKFEQALIVVARAAKSAAYERGSPATRVEERLDEALAALEALIESERDS